MVILDVCSDALLLASTALGFSDQTLVAAFVCLFKEPSQSAAQSRYISQQMPQRFGDSLHH